jgi:hypothetical protein
MSNQIIPATPANMLPTIDAEARLIHGTALKFVDGKWTADGVDMNGTKLLALHHVQAVQHWCNQKCETIIEYPGEARDLDAMNAAIPKEQWEVGLNGEPRPPWERVRALYLLDERDASLYTHASGTVGTRIAHERLVNRMRWMSAIRGGNIFPLVKLDSRTFKSRIGPKARPEYTVTEWRDLGAGSVPALGGPSAGGSAPALGKLLKPPAAAEMVGDEIPF